MRNEKRKEEVVFFGFFFKQQPFNHTTTSFFFAKYKRDKDRKYRRGRDGSISSVTMTQPVAGCEREREKNTEIPFFFKRRG